jgi:cytochrome oxidase Cu insertion factor (SCO1/SenC/PrrC family)
MTKHSGFWRSVIKNPFVWGFVIGMVALYVVRDMSNRRRGAPPPLVEVGAWKMQDHTGKTFGSEELKGKVYVASFFFTRCPTICPKLTESIIEVSKRFKGLEDKVHFVGVSVDPANDTPDVLSAYMKKYGIEGPNWSYLTGAPKDVYNIVVGQMKLHVGDKEPFKGERASSGASSGAGAGANANANANANARPETYEINHVGELVLFDQNGDLRGKFGTDSVNLAALERAAKLLVERGA